MYLFFNTNTHSRQWREKKNEQNNYDEGAEVVHKEKKSCTTYLSNCIRGCFCLGEMIDHCCNSISKGVLHFC